MRARDRGREWNEGIAAGRFLSSPGPIEFLRVGQVRKEIGAARYLHMIPWPGAFVTLFTTENPVAPFAVALQEESTAFNQPFPPDVFFCYERGEHIRMSMKFIDYDTDLDCLLLRLNAELDRREPSAPQPNRPEGET